MTLLALLVLALALFAGCFVLSRVGRIRGAMRVLVAVSAALCVGCIGTGGLRFGLLAGGACFAGIILIWLYVEISEHRWLARRRDSATSGA